MTYTRERYNASKRPSWSPDELRAEFDRVQRGIPRAQEIDLRDFGSVGGGNDDTVALARWARAVQETGDGYIPKGTFIHDGTLTLAPTRATKEVRVRFDPEAWLAPTAGWGLKLDGAFNTTLERPRVKLIGSSTATRGIWVIDSRWPKLYQPTVWSFIEIPSSFVCIDVDDNSYWTEVQYPQIRKNSGSITSNFATGVRFRDVSNACTVWGGSINHCDNGVYIDGLNGCRVMGTAFEDCTDGVEVAEGATGPNGHIVAFCRFEATTNDVNISASTIIANGWPVQIFGTVYTSNDTILNPNSLPLYTRSHGGIRVKANDASFELRNGGVRLRDSSGNGYFEANGSTRINADMDGSGSGTVSLRIDDVEQVGVDTTGLLLASGKTIRNTSNVILNADSDVSGAGDVIAQVGGTEKFRVATAGSTSPVGHTVTGNDQVLALRNGAVQLRDSGGAGFVESNGNVTINADLDNNGSGEVRLRLGTAQKVTVSATGVSCLDPVTADYFIGSVASPAQITGNRDDYSGLGTAETARLSSDASRNITGFTGGVDGRNARVINVGAQNIVLQNQNVGSAEANRIITGTGADVTLAADDTAQLWYDGTTARWRIVGNY